MKEKTLANTNLSLKADTANRCRTRSLASSTAIETGESIKALEQKINHLRNAKHRVRLA